MGRMGRFTDESRNHKRQSQATEAGERNREEYSYDSLTYPHSLSEEKAADYHPFGAGTRGEGGARRPGGQLQARPPTWHDTKRDDKVNWGYGPTRNEEQSDG